MPNTYDQLRVLANQINNLSANDLQRLGRILVHDTPVEACDLLDGIQGEFSLIEQGLFYTAV